MEADISYVHVRRSTSNDTNAFLGTPVLKGFTNQEALAGKDVLVVDDMLDRGVTMRYVLELLQSMKPKSIHVAVLYNFVSEGIDDEMYLTGLFMPQKKWIVFPWETKLSLD